MRGRHKRTSNTGIRFARSLTPTIQKGAACPFLSSRERRTHPERSFGIPQHREAREMSFDQLSSLEAGDRRGAGYSDDPDFQRLSQQLNNKLFKLQGNISSLSRDIGHLGTRQDTARVRERVHDQLEETRDIFKEVGEGVKKISGWPDVTVRANPSPPPPITGVRGPRGRADSN